ncbi:TPA: AAA family ATPase, partial [Mannheimia haemolytica]|nr:AAA family ATPase [Mannheimia haemolytica]
MPSLFITGTDTNVGKTVVTRAIIQTLTKHSFPVIG